MARFGNSLRRLRGSRSQREVSQDLGMPVTTLSSLENQDTIPRGPMLKRLADYYGVPISYFYEVPTSPLKSSAPAKQWLLSIREMAGSKDAIATHAPPDFAPELKNVIGEAIRKKKRAETAGDE